MPDNAIATRTTTPFETELATYEPQFASALPGHIPVERFKRTVITALNSNADLARADRRSLFTACIRSAQDGLFPDGREAALVIFNSKDKKTGEWRKLVQYMPMVGGIIKRLRNSGELASISAYVVFSNDEFDYELGDNPHIKHKPSLGDRGAPIGVYATAKLNNGETLREVMSVAEVEKVRAVSRAKDDGPWVDWWEEMARKSVIRRLSKRLPGSSDLEDLLRREEAQYVATTIEGGPSQRPRREQFMGHAEEIIDPEPEHDDSETGGISKSLLEVGNEICEMGIEPLREWWRSLTPSQRGELGAKGRSLGKNFEGWVLRANAADERGGPPEDEEQASPESPAEQPATVPDLGPELSQAKPQEDVFGLPISDDEAFCHSVIREIRKCTLLAGVDEIKARWNEGGQWWGRVNRLPEAMFTALLMQVSQHEDVLKARSVA
jgi:phage RecT family recombinase